MSACTKTKALLIGIGDDGSQNLFLGPQKDVRRMRKLLIETYGYEKENIVVMHDRRKKSWLQPTKGNILREIDDLVKDCQPGDRFVFHYSGHTGQQWNLNGTKADGKDERIEVMNGESILDYELSTVSSTAFPAGGPATSILPPDNYTFSPVSTLEASPVTVTSPDRRNNLMRNAAIDDEGESYHGACLTCPILQRDKVRQRNADLPMVLAISACTDAQRSYEDSKGNGMTTILCEFLQEFPNPSLNRLHTRISFGLFKPSWTRVHSKKWLEFVASLREQGDEANYYQHPSLSSLQRLNLNHKLRL